MTSNIISFPRHKMQQFGDTGLSCCETCGGAEGMLPEDCPQRELSQEEGDAIMAGTLDFRRKHGGWTSWTRSHEMAVKRLVT